MKQQTLYVGIDLGCHKTSVLASNGSRATFASAVGVPKDHVAELLLGRKQVIGDAVEQHRMSLDIVRPFENGRLKYVPQDAVLGVEAERGRRAARDLIAHAVQLMQPSPATRVLGVIGAPSRASVTSKQFLLEAAAGTFDSVFIVAEPFAVAYEMQRLAGTLVVDIGAGTTDLCPMYGAYPSEEDQVTIHLGGDAIDQSIHESLCGLASDIRVSKSLARHLKEHHATLEDADSGTTVSLPVAGVPTDFEISSILRSACMEFVEPISEAIREIVSRFDPEIQGQLRENILLAGGGSRLRGLDSVLETRMQKFGGGRVETVGDSVYAGAAGALKLAMNMPESYWTEIDGDTTLAAA